MDECIQSWRWVRLLQIDLFFEASIFKSREFKVSCGNLWDLAEALDIALIGQIYGILPLPQAASHAIKRNIETHFTNYVHTSLHILNRIPWIEHSWTAMSSNLQEHSESFTINEIKGKFHQFTKEIQNQWNRHSTMCNNRCASTTATIPHSTSICNWSLKYENPNKWSLEWWCSYGVVKIQPGVGVTLSFIGAFGDTWDTKSLTREESQIASSRIKDMGSGGGESTLQAMAS